MLAGRGSAWGVLFLPAGFAPFWSSSVHTLRDRRIPFGEVFDRAQAGPLDRTSSAALTACDEALSTAALVASINEGVSDAFAVPQLGCYLFARMMWPPAPPEVRGWVTSIESDPVLIRVERLAERHGVSVRRLQRAMRHHVGLGPKQLVRRYRLFEAASRLASGEPCNHASLVVSLGYADQAHFAREFRAVTGTSPGQRSKQVGAKVPYPTPISTG